MKKSPIFLSWCWYCTKTEKRLCLFATQFHNSPKLHSDNLRQMAEFFQDQKYKKKMLSMVVLCVSVTKISKDCQYQFYEISNQSAVSKLPKCHLERTRVHLHVCIILGGNFLVKLENVNIRSKYLSSFITT